MDSKQLLGNALEDVLYDKFMLELANCQENAKCSRKHFQTMQEIIGCKIKKIGSHSRRIVAAILVAATLLLVGCVAYVYREEIKGFFVEFHDDHMEIVPDRDAPIKESIEEIYQLTYIPAGFQKVNSRNSFVVVNYQYMNEDGQLIEFWQRPYSKAYFDTEDTNHSTMELAGKEILHIQYEEIHTFVWSDNGYAFTLECDYPIPSEELQKMIEEMHVLQQ